MFIKGKLALKRGSSFSDKFRLLVLAAYTSRPRLRPMLKPIVKSFTERGTIKVDIALAEKSDKNINVYLRDKHFDSDYLSMSELALFNCYHLPIKMKPDIIVDGGGNTGLFTLLCNKYYPGVPVLTYEPVEENIAAINRHLDANNSRCNLFPGIITLKDGDLPFYLRNANNSSFDPHEPYHSQISIRSFNLVNELKSHSFNNALIKLDIEGSEVEVLPDLLAHFPNKNFVIVGELHDWPQHLENFRKVCVDHGYEISISDQDDACLVFAINRK
jgi:FkbM family methyltransferase